MDIEKLENILGKMPEPILLIRPDQRVLGANNASHDLFGGDLTGRHLVSFIRQPAVLSCVSKILIGEDQAQTKFVAQGSVETVFRVLVRKLGREQDGIDGALLSFHDVTQAENTAQMHSDFVANVSHELRSPLTALTGFIETLQGPARDDEAVRENFLKIMQAEAGRMRRLLDDLLSLSRVEIDERVRPTDSVDIVALLWSVAANLVMEARNAECQIDIQPAPELLEIQADKDQMRQVFLNLIENAIKYGGGGDVAVSVAELPTYPGITGRVVRVDVIDAGPGVDPVHIPRLTERFYRIDTHRSREVGGTGLGLAIVKHIVMRHRGRLLIRPGKERGMVFSVLLPTT